MQAVILEERARLHACTDASETSESVRRLMRRREECNRKVGREARTVVREQRAEVGRVEGTLGSVGFEDDLELVAQVRRARTEVSIQASSLPTSVSGERGDRSVCVGQAENEAMSVRVPEGDLHLLELATALLRLLLEGDGEVLVDLRSHHLWDLLYNLQADLLADRFTRRRAERTLTRRCGQTPKM